MKVRTTLRGVKGDVTINEGDFGFCMQATRDKKRQGLEINIDWSFPEDATFEEVRSGFGGLFQSIEDVFGEKMFTEAVSHYAQETGKLKITEDGKGEVAMMRSKGMPRRDPVEAVKKEGEKKDA